MPALCEKTKHPASVMSLGFVVSNGAVMNLIWFSSWYRLTARNHKVKLADKLISLINSICDMSSVTVVLQKDDAPAYTSNRVQPFLHEQNFSFWSINMWPPFWPDANPLDYAFWSHTEARACKVRHQNITALKTSVDREWMAMSRDYVMIPCEAFRRRLEGAFSSNGGYIE